MEEIIKPFDLDRSTTSVYVTSINTNAHRLRILCKLILLLQLNIILDNVIHELSIL